MDLSKVVAISGKPGLFLVSGQGSGKLVVESLLDGKRTPAFANDRISSLEEISIYTTGDDKPLKEVFMSIHEKLGDNIGFDPKKVSPVELKEKYTIVMVTHNMQQAARIADKTAFFLLGEVIEFDETEKMFSTPRDKRTEDYITGRFG
mgnify:CR=1 FL=1